MVTMIGVLRELIQVTRLPVLIMFTPISGTSEQSQESTAMGIVGEGDEYPSESVVRAAINWWKT